MSKPKLGRVMYDWLEAKKIAERDQLGAPEAGTVEMTAQEIAEAERDKAALLAKKRAEIPSRSASAEIATNDLVVDPVTETMSPSSTELNDRLAALEADHSALMNAANDKYEATRRRILEERRAAEIEESRTANVSIAPTLREALDSVKSSAVVAAEVEAEDTEHGDQAQQEAWKREYGPAIATGRKVLRELRAFEKAHGAALREAASLSATQLMVGLPRTGLAAGAAQRTVTTLKKTANDAVTLAEVTRRGTEDAIREIEKIIENPARWSGGINGNGVKHQDTVRELNTHRRDLRGPVDVVVSLNAMAGSVTSLLQSVAAMREKYLGDPSVAVEPIIMGPRGEAAGRLNDPAPPDGYTQARATTSHPDGLFGDGSVVGRA